ncbi:hypothetical protein [Catellatospora tritici]|uniref:hypothetical protein n=1 Tax=Catellatospora tritici TaxID=2851566 RepID=UPI001C2DD665|nr:hypothetical protein [Catellatospora tritici]MBV1849333.1 hypothetical protein [Catellatospora tritici]
MSGVSAEQRLFDAVARWNTDTGHGLRAVIDAACQALVDGLDSPSLRELAGASAKDSSYDLHVLTVRSLEELDIPYPGTVSGGFSVAAGGGVLRRPGVDALRLEVVPAGDEAGGGFQVRVHVNDVEVTAAGAGLGMDPYELLVPTNRLIATAEVRRVPIARCECGVYGCGSTDVTIIRDGDTVHWDWLIEVPMSRGVSFDAAAYDAEVARMALDHSWETPERTAGRLVLRDADRGRLAEHGLRLTWAANHYRDHEVFQVALQLGDDYRIFMGTPWRGRGPEELARAVCEELAQPPHKWHAGWHSIKRELSGPPVIAGRSWSRASF